MDYASPSFRIGRVHERAVKVSKKIFLNFFLTIPSQIVYIHKLNSRSRKRHGGFAMNSAPATSTTPMGQPPKLLDQVEQIAGAKGHVAATT
jgi:hypothetical protein